jgi:hypothetical protein
VSTGRRFLIAVPLVAALLLGSADASASLAGGWVAGLTGTAASAHNAYFAGRSYPEAGGASVTTEFFVPRLTCTSTNSGVAVGAFIYTSAGHGSRPLLSAASVQLFCLRSEPAPLPVVELKGKQVYGDRRPHIGDLMKATVIDSAGVLSVTLQDLTDGHAFTLSRSTTSAPATAAAIGDDALKGVPSLTPGPVYPITDFGSLHFSAGRVNGRPLGAAGGKAFDMVSADRRVQIRTGPLRGRGPTKARSAFVTTWKRS